MKKTLSAFLLLALLLTLSACGNKESGSSVDISILSSGETVSGSSSQIPGATVTIPKYIVDLIGVNISQKAKALGIDSISTEEDGSVCYSMSAETKKKIVSDMKSELLSYISSMPADWPFIKKIDINDSFDHITIVADGKSYNKLSSRAMGAAAYIPVVSYRAFAELDIDSKEEFVLGFSVIDVNDYSEVDEFKYPVEESGKTTSTVSGEDRVSGTEYADSEGESSTDASADESTESTENP